jgi:hypothetical protein
MISMRSMVSISLCIYLTRMPCSCRYSVRSSAIRFGQHGDEAAVAGLRGGADLADEIVDLRARRADIDRRIDQAGRADHLFDEHAADSFSSHALGVADTATDCGRIMSHSSNRSGRLSMQEGSRKPYSAKGRLAAEVAFEHAADLGHRDVAFVGEHQRVVGDIFEQGRRRLAGAASGQIARIVFDAGAGAGGFHHFEIEGGALLQPLRFQQAALVVELVQPHLQFDLIDLIACTSVGRGVT